MHPWFKRTMERCFYSLKSYKTFKMFPFIDFHIMRRHLQTEPVEKCLPRFRDVFTLSFFKERINVQKVLRLCIVTQRRLRIAEAYHDLILSANSEPTNLKEWYFEITWMGIDQFSSINNQSNFLSKKPGFNFYSTFSEEKKFLQNQQ